MEALRLYFMGILELPPPVLAMVVAVFASLVGSFVNVCIWRIPRGESVVFPSSHCTACGHRLGVVDLIPFFSQLALGSKCRYCGVRYSWRYLFVELLVMLLWVGAFLVFGPTWTFVCGGVGASLVVVVVGIALMRRGGEGEEEGEEVEDAVPASSASSASSAANRRGLSFLEILFTTVILVSVIGPFLSIMRSSYMGAEKNRELIVAYNLAAEKIEELKVLPVAKLAGDWNVYVKGEKLTDNIFADEFFGKYAKMDEDEDFFLAEFSDVLTESAHFTDTVQEKFQRNFQRYYGFAYRYYPRGYEKYFRVTQIKKIANESNPANPLVKVTVTVTIRSRITKGKKVALATYLSKD